MNAKKAELLSEYSRERLFELGSARLGGKSDCQIRFPLWRILQNSRRPDYFSVRQSSASSSLCERECISSHLQSISTQVPACTSSQTIRRRWPPNDIREREQSHPGLHALLSTHCRQMSSCRAMSLIRKLA